MKYILASQSPRRKQLLEMAEIDFKIQVSATDETYPNGLEIEQIPIHIAQQKALVVSQQFPQHCIIAADTIVVLQNEIIGKPVDATHASQILQKLSGQEHRVITGVSIIHPKQDVHFADTTHVCFNNLTNEQINYYIEKYKPYDKAGAYAIQEWIGAIAIRKIHGCFYNVMGLPISRVVQSLQSLSSIA